LDDDDVKVEYSVRDLKKSYMNKT